MLNPNPRSEISYQEILKIFKIRPLVEKKGVREKERAETS